jgi:hypothetical protein
MFHYLTSTFVMLLSMISIAIFGLGACTDTKSIKFKTIYIGENASWKSPEKTGAHHNSPNGVFGNSASVEASWLKRSISADDLRHVLSKVDFNHQVLIVDARFEEPHSAERPIFDFVAGISIEDVYIYRSSDNRENIVDVWTVNQYVSVDCKLRKPLTNPFILAVIEREKVGEMKRGGYTHSSKTVECKPFKTGVINP